MAKKKTNQAIDTGATVTKEALKKGSVMIDASSFDELEGETFAGLNILKLTPGQAAGPITITQILLNQKLGKDAASKKRKPVDVYCGQFNGIQMRLPVAASFVAKAKEANVSVGDVIALKREADYQSQFKTTGASYVLKVISRA
jgi:hypothetical protein